ncbi:MAG: OmpA family protein [Crocinitomicaceae bacterium]
MKNILILGIALFISVFGSSQMNYSTKNKKAIKYFEEGMKKEMELDPSSNRPNYRGGIELFQKAIEKDPNFIEAYGMCMNFYEKIGQTDKAYQTGKKAIDLNLTGPGSSFLYYKTAELGFKEKEYETAIQLAEKFLKTNRNPEMKVKAEEIISSSKFALESIAEGVEIRLVNLGEGINTKDPEYFPSLTVDEKTIIFTRQIHVPNTPDHIPGQEDLYISHLGPDGKWIKATPLPSNINHPMANQGAPSIGADGSTVVFIGCQNVDGTYPEGYQGFGSCDIYITKKLGNKWYAPRNLGNKINSFNWETQPSLSADGKTMYFIRGDRRIKQQAMVRPDLKLNVGDIFVSYLDEEGNWSDPIKLPDNVNTPYKEESVFIHPDGRTLYFGSDGHPGLGGTDIFMTRLQDDGSWSNPINLGHPINSPADEATLIVAASGRYAMLGSDRPGGFGDMDIYQFNMPEKFRPNPVIYMEGIAFNAKNQEERLGAKFQLFDLETGKEVVRSQADPVTGEFLVTLPVNKDYSLIANHDGFLMFTKNFTLTEPENSEEAYHLNVPMQPFEAGSAVRLDNIFFDFGKYTLRKESYVELDKFVKFLKNNPSLKIELGGHTDTRGDAKDNQILSENRAKAVADYLVLKGIPSTHITYKGYGESQPLVSDEAIEELANEKEKEAAHQQNRRTEYKIIEILK